MIRSHRRSGMNFLNQLHWRPTIGDPSFMGWFTVFAYGVGAILAARAWFGTKDRIWLAVALGMAALCVNKQLDLQSLFTDIGRVAAYHEGWYERRREFQKWFVLAAIAGAGIGGGCFIWRYPAFWLRHKLLTAGVFFLLTFIIVRAISFHHVDGMLKVKLLGVKVNWALELGGILLVSIAAVRKPAGQTTTG
jgi:hypothetical protein